MDFESKLLVSLLGASPYLCPGPLSGLTPAAAYGFSRRQPATHEKSPGKGDTTIPRRLSLPKKCAIPQIPKTIHG